MKIGLSLLIDQVPSPAPDPCHVPLEEKVKQAICLIDSGHESREEWQWLRRLNNHLMRKDKLSAREEKILRAIQPVMEKYGANSPYKVEQKAEYTTPTRPTGDLDEY